MNKIFDEDRGVWIKTSFIKKYELIDSKKSGGSTIVRAGLGAALLGPVGLLAGATAKKKYSVLITYNDGNSKLIKIGEDCLKTLIEDVKNN